MKKKLISYQLSGGGCPFELWFEQHKIAIRLQRVANGNLGKVRNVGGGVYELKFKIKGLLAYRIYFGNAGKELILLLCGGDKTNQSKDIMVAKEYLNDYKIRKEIAEPKL